MKFKILLAFLLFLCVYTFKLPTSFYPDTDFTRDVYEMIKINQGKMTLIGPALRIGIFAGPYYYYLFAPALALANFDTNYVLYFNVFLFASALGYLYWKTRNFYPVVIVGISNFYLLSARHPGNGYSYLPLLLVIITTLFVDESFGKLKSGALGLLAGIVVNFHPLTIFPVLISVVLNWRKLLSKKYLIIFFVLTFSPLLLFELKHEFVITKGLLIVKNYTSFLTSNTYPIYYIYPLLLLSVFLLSKYFVNRGSKLLLSTWLTGLILMFPYNLYLQTTKTMKQTEDIVQKIIGANIVTDNITFNLISITDEKHLVPMGHEYRFAFRKSGLKPLDENNYVDAQDLLIFMETDKVNIETFRTWETEQSGLVGKIRPDKFIIDGVTVYKYAKKDL